MVPGPGSIKKVSTLNPDAPVFKPSSTGPVMVDLSAEDCMSEGPDSSLRLPWSLDVTLEEDLMATYGFLNGDPEVLPSEWNVDDFSREWWNLVHTSPSFREYWIQRYEIEEDYFNQAYLLEAGDEMRLSCKQTAEEERATAIPWSIGLDMTDLIQMKKVTQLNKSVRELPSRYHNKISQISPKRVTARKIQQPR